MSPFRMHPEHRLEQREEESREAQARRRRRRAVRRIAATSIGNVVLTLCPLCFGAGGWSWSFHLREGKHAAKIP